MNIRLLLIVIGLVVGGIVGWATAPQPTNVELGPLKVQVQPGNGEGGSVTATNDNGQINIQVGSNSPLDDRNTRTLIFAVIGAAVGAAAGYFNDRTRKT